MEHRSPSRIHCVGATGDILSTKPGLHTQVDGGVPGTWFRPQDAVGNEVELVLVTLLAEVFVEVNPAEAVELDVMLDGVALLVGPNVFVLAEVDKLIIDPVVLLSNARGSKSAQSAMESCPRVQPLGTLPLKMAKMMDPFRQKTASPPSKAVFLQ